jgi:hypothetical protein
MKHLRVSIMIFLTALMCFSGAGLPSAARAEASGRTLPWLGASQANGAIGGYVEQVNQVAVAVEATGRIHVLWTGVLNPYFDNFVFYSSSTDGVNWTPYQILNYWQGYDPQIAVDDVHHRVHLMYRSNSDGIIHRTVTNGVVSAPVVVDNSYATAPRLAVDPISGFAYAVWLSGNWVPLENGSNIWRRHTWYAYWNGSSWSERINQVNDGDTCDSTIAAAPGGGLMLAWFQRCTQSMGGPSDPGLPNEPRTAYSNSSPSRFPLRQAVSAYYTIPEKDDTILLTYSTEDGKYYLVSEHLMWPGHSRVYRYTWQNGAWSSFLDVAKNTANWAVPQFVGAAANQALVIYVYQNNNIFQMRTETNGTLGAVQNLADYFAARGYSGTPLGYFTDRTGGLHVVLVGDKNGIAGFYYVAP